MFWNTSTADTCDNCNSSRMANNSSNFPDFAMESSFTEKEEEFESPEAKYEADMSMYESNSPARMSCDGSPENYPTTLRRRFDTDDHNSLDSGYSASEPPRFSSPPKSHSFSFGSFTSMDEESLDICELEQENENPSLPQGFNKLITGSLSVTDQMISPELTITRPPLRRALSLIGNSTTPITSRARSCLFGAKDEIDLRNFKRPEPPNSFLSPVNSKRTKVFHNLPIQRIQAKTVFQRSVSANEDSIKSAVQRSITERDLIGDFTKSFCLPLIPGKHQDLKSISATTLSRLMLGEFSNSIVTYRIIDCRFPYEFEGGHIEGAQNLYTKQQILDELLSVKAQNVQPQESEDQKRHILIFHCEFSSERGPNLSRYLRNMDRTQNKDYYPFLHYPEIYLLDGGYKLFHENHSEMCLPNGYLPMLHPDHEQSLRHFRQQSKSFNLDAKSKSNLRLASFKRL